MKVQASITPLADADVAGLPVLPASGVQLRRDIYLFVDFVNREGLKRSHRTNGIPKGPATKLAKILSYAGEMQWVSKEGEGLWSDKVSRVALDLGLVTYDVEGIYAGYSSSAPSFPNNEIKLNEKKWTAWLDDTPVHKEQAILASLVEHAQSEFFHRATLVEGKRFDYFGCATGPHSRIKFPPLRRALLKILAQLPAGVWLPMDGLISLIQAQAPTLILDPALRQRVQEGWLPYEKLKEKRPPPQLESLYGNFAEATVRDPWIVRDAHRFTENTPNVFRRVEGRYLQYFLEEIPYLCGLVDLALPPPRKPTPDDPVPPLETIRAFRLSPRLRQVVLGEPELNAVSVTVLPNFEIVITAPSYPDTQIHALKPFCRSVREDGPTHVLMVDRKMVMEFAANQPEAPPIEAILKRWISKPIPSNVATEIAGWCGHAEKLTVYPQTVWVELRGSSAQGEEVRRELGALVVDDRCPGFLVVKDANTVVGVLEQRARVPVEVHHSATGFAPCPGPLGSPPPKKPKPTKEQPAAKPAQKVTVSVQDMVAYRIPNKELRKALHDALQDELPDCHLIPDAGLVLVKASDLPTVRAAFKRLEKRFEVQFGD